MKFLRATGLGLTVATLAACGGGTGASVAPLAKSPTVLGSPSATVASVRVKAVIHIPRSKKTTSANKSRKYVSPSTEGLIIVVNQSTPNENVQVSLTGYDLTTNSASSTCTVDQTGNDCTIYLNAPATNSSLSDQFQIYAYDHAEPNAITSNSQVAGNLLSEDIGAADSNGDPVPSSTNPGISATGTNTLTFTLSPVVATVEGTLGTFEDGPFGTTTSLVLSVPGTGGTTNSVAIDGYDADGNEIQRFLSPSGGDDTYANPINLSLSGSNGSSFTFDGTNTTKTITSALASDSVTAIYTPGPNDAPTSDSSSVAFATMTVGAPFTGGFDSTTNYPLSTQTPAPIIIAPMYAYVDSNAASATIGKSGNIYALAMHPATSANYTLTVTTGDCTGYTIGALNQSNLTNDQQAVFPITIGTDTGNASACVLTLSDGMSNDTITLQPPTSSGTTTTVTVPNANAAPVYQTSGTTQAGVPYTFSARNAGDMLLCLVSFNEAGSLVSKSASVTNPNDTLYDVTSPNSYISNENGYSGEEGFATDAQSAGDAITNIEDNTPLSYWCAEYQNTTAAKIANASNPNAEFAGNTSTTGETPVTNTDTPGAILIQTASGDAVSGLSYDRGFAHNANIGINPSLFVESSTGLEQGGGNNQTWTPNLSSGNPTYTEGFVQIPITPSLSDARKRSSHTRRK